MSRAAGYGSSSDAEYAALAAGAKPRDAGKSALLAAVAVPLHTAYAEYSSNTHWLMLVLTGIIASCALLFAMARWDRAGKRRRSEP